MRYQFQIFVLVSIVLFNCDSGSNANQKYSTILTRDRGTGGSHTFTDVSMENCEDFTVLMSVSKLSRKLDRSKAWIIKNYQIPLYADTLTQDSRIIGHALPGGHCFIVEQRGLWYFVQSPSNNELGWLAQEFVVGFVKKNPKTLLPCPERIP
ncbi:MAG: hypothetical protein L3J79_07415 [Candidatus Marinimicrobia bacterium]|nr:hypothetical protein [Candidatus Neomarinimicrobiota bacterium]